MAKKSKRPKKLKVYLAGPMRGLPHLNFPMFDKVAAVLRKQGYKVITPAEISREMDGFNEETNKNVRPVWEYLARDIELLRDCDLICFLRGWEQSTGSLAEIAYINALGRAACVRYYDPESRSMVLEPLCGSSYEQTGRRIGKLVAEKKAAYGDSIERSRGIMKILYPDGVPPEKFDDALIMLRVIDKQCRISTDKDAFGESPWSDIIGYALRALNLVQLKRQRNSNEAP